MSDSEKFQRKCIVTRHHDRMDKMLRFVVGQNGTVAVDYSAALPGRGYWVCAERKVLENPKLKHILSRMSSENVVFSEDFLLSIEKSLLSRMRNIIHLARRASEILFGYAKVREQIVKRKKGFILCDIEASKKELMRLCSGNHDFTIVSLPTHLLEDILNRENVTYAFFQQGKLAERLKIETEKYWSTSGRLSVSPAD